MCDVIPNPNYVKRELFYHLMTSSNDFEKEIDFLENSLEIRRVLGYLSKVRTGNGKISYCPFVKMIEKNDGYYVDFFSVYNLEGAVYEIEKQFKTVSKSQTHQAQLPDPTTIIAAFSESFALEKEFCEKLTQMRDSKRQHFLDQGLMIAYMHPYHELGSAKENATNSDCELYTSDIPLLMVRRMHKEDYVFMHTDSEKDAYMKYFGTIPVQKCSYHL